ncbi:MAG: hypothetical protein PF437_00550 [Sulfurimonas sp.]|jgi:hypothetical protein|nr:hypothetical protein [Sulfurimonas sp.]
MKHTYLSQTVIEEALKDHSITENEAAKLKKKIDCQSTIFKFTHKED